MKDVHMEPEVAEAELRATGCPYASSDKRAAVWIEGYMAGTAKAFEDFERIQKAAFAEAINGLAA